MKKKNKSFLVGIVTFCLIFPLTSIGADKKTPKKYPDVVYQTDIGKKIYIYCRTGGRAALVTKAFQDLGFTNVVHVNMKIAEWKKAGYPTAM